MAEQELKSDTDIVSSLEGKNDSSISVEKEIPSQLESYDHIVEETCSSFDVKVDLNSTSEGHSDCHDSEEVKTESACEFNEEQRSSSQNMEPNDSSTEPVDITPNQDGGITKQLMKEGTGDEMPGYGYTVSVRYRGYMIVGGSVQPLTCKEGVTQIVLGKGTVVPGLEIAISSMKKNEIAVFVVQPNYGYGEMGIPKIIPPYSILCFEVELLDWKYEDLSPKKDDSILRKVMEKGEGSRFPNEGALVKIEITGYYKGEIFEKREEEFILGEGTVTADIPEGVEIALYKFRLNEISMLYLKPKFAYSSIRCQKQDIPADAPVEYKVKLVSFEKAKDLWEMNSDEKFEKSKEARMKGVNYFKSGHYKVALKQFKKIIACLEKEPGVVPDTEESRRMLLIAGHSNTALCYKKLENYTEAIKALNKVLELDPENEKALYQRGQCLMLINDCDEALGDFHKLLSLKPGNVLCKKSIDICQAKLKQQHLKDKAVYSNMFEKLASKNQEEKIARNRKPKILGWPSKNSTQDCIVKVVNEDLF